MPKAERCGWRQLRLESRSMPSAAPPVVTPSPCRVLSVDVDDLVIAYADFCGERLPAGYVSDLERELESALDLLGECGVLATVFVNAQYCERFPGLARAIASRGHHLASHGLRHQNVARLSLAAFEEDLRRSLDLLGRAQSPIIGYRPPAFSMPYDEAHIEILACHGIRYVSAGVGVARSDAPRTNVPVDVHARIRHVPISTAYFLGGRLKYPIGYGVVARLMPERLYLFTLRRWLRTQSFLHFYCHSFELGGLTPRGPMPLTGWSARVGAGVYAWRCRDRREYLKSILTSARFQSIETQLFDGQGVGGTQAGEEQR
jgi:peptidoglycan/xylan/chitin deacetylase (PgdA/CDA1 family)